MHHFAYKDGVLHAEDVNLARLAAEVKTPFYCYSTATLERHYRVLAEATRGFAPLICFAVKANSNQAVLRTLAGLGAGMDVVSEGELRRALAARVPPEKIIFAGVGKTRPELAFALKQGILAFNVESAAELVMLSEEAERSQSRARIAIRVNPDVDAKTHAKIATGKSENKFGVPFADARALYAEAAHMPGLEVAGVHMHIGSQIRDTTPFRQAFAAMRALLLKLRSDGHTIRHVDLGGGLGVPYRPGEATVDPECYAALIAENFGDLDADIVLEPGRMIAANAGILVTQVVLVKEGADRAFAVVDAAMNDLIRPTLYNAHHEIWPVEETKADSPAIAQDVVGPVCETGDYLALGRALPPLASGDLLAVMTAGAYGATMSSTYNSRLLVPEVLVKGADYAVVRPRPSYADLVGLDRLPGWL